MKNKTLGLYSSRYSIENDGVLLFFTCSDSDVVEIVSKGQPTLNKQYLFVPLPIELQSFCNSNFSNCFQFSWHKENDQRGKLI